MTSTRKKHSSHTWRAILSGREVLAQGLIKRIGDGSSTDIWRDRWLPNHFDARPLTPQEGQDVQRVSDLITDDGQWDEARIRQTFISVDAAAILRIPIRAQVDDLWAWEMEKHGVYSVKSAYRLLDSNRFIGNATDSPSASENEVWKLIWKLKVNPCILVEGDP